MCQKQTLIGWWLNVVRKSTDNLSTAILPRFRIPVAEETAVKLCPCMACTLSQLSPQTPCVLPKKKAWFGPLGIEPRWHGSRLNVLTIRLWPTIFTDCTFSRLELAHQWTYAHLFEGKGRTHYRRLTHFLVEIGL